MPIIHSKTQKIQISNIKFKSLPFYCTEYFKKTNYFPELCLNVNHFVYILVSNDKGDDYMKDQNTAYFYALISFMLLIMLFFAPIDSFIIQFLLFFSMLCTAAFAYKLYKQVQFLRLGKTTDDLFSSYDYE